MAVKHPRISSPEYALEEATETRVAVWYSHVFGGWVADRVTPYVAKTFPAHAEAIAYAQTIARQA